MYVVGEDKITVQKDMRYITKYCSVMTSVNRREV